jgi:hypothetical protein
MEQRLFFINMAQSGMPKKISKEATRRLALAETTPPPQEETTLEPPCEEPQIFLHVLLGISAC